MRGRKSVWETYQITNASTPWESKHSSLTQAVKKALANVVQDHNGTVKANRMMMMMMN